MRCLTLAHELRRRGGDVRFICREHPGHLVDRVENEGLPVRRLPPPDTGANATDEDYSSWRGVSEDTDAAETLTALGDLRPEWLVVDHYGLGRQWERTIRPAVARIFAIDDLERDHDCDLLLDQNWFGDATSARYAGKVPDGCRLLLGPRYALLRPEYAQLRAMLPPRDGTVRRVVIFFGGSDPTNETAKVLQALSAASMADLAVDVVIGANHADADGIQAMVAARRDATLHRDLPTLAGLMARADVAVGGGGATTWERLCTGLATLVVTLAANQEPFTEALARAGYVQWVGSAATTTPEAYLEALLDHRGSSRPVTQRALVDGLGAKRVAEVILPSAPESISVRPTPHQQESAVAATLEAFGVRLAEFSLTLEEDAAQLSYTIDPVAHGRALDAVVIAEATASAAGRLVRLTQAPQGQPAGDHTSIVFLSDARSWINPHLRRFLPVLIAQGHRVAWSHDMHSVPVADLCFLLGWKRIVRRQFRERYRHVLVVHASDLPRGRGMSPMTWRVLGGASRLPVSLIEAEDAVDSGAIYAQEWLTLAGNELLPELQQTLGESTMRLCAGAIEAYGLGRLVGQPQQGEPTTYRWRKPQDSRLDPDRSIREQFNLLRVVDNEKYPAFFDLHGRRYVVQIHCQVEQS